MYDEEKRVAEKAPVEVISINDLSLNKKKPIPNKSIYFLLKHQFIDINYPEDLKLVKKIFKRKY